MIGTLLRFNRKENTMAIIRQPLEDLMAKTGSYYDMSEIDKRRKEMMGGPRQISNTISKATEYRPHGLRLSRRRL